MITTILAALLGFVLYTEVLRPHVLRYLAKREVSRW